MKVYKLPHTLPMGMEILNPFTVIPHSESTIDVEVEFIVSTQYVMSSTGSNEKGAVQVRKVLVFPRLTSGDPTADSGPINGG